MMNRTFKLAVLYSAAATMALVSCQKINELPKSPEVKEILSYVNDSEMKAALYEVLSLSHEERLARETEQGFKSLGTIAQEFYETIDPEQFKSIEKIKAFAAQHNEYLQLIPEENGEFTLEIIAYKNPYRYLANENGELKVGENIYKITEEAVVDVNTQSVLAYSPAKGEKTRAIRKSAQDIGLSFLKTFYDDPQSGKNKLVVEFYNAIEVRTSAQTMLVINCRIQPYHRVMGTWFWCNRTLGVECEVKGTFYNSNRSLSYPIDWSRTIQGSGKDLRDAIVVLAVPYQDDNCVLDIDKYRLKGWSGSGISKEWAE